MTPCDKETWTGNRLRFLAGLGIGTVVVLAVWFCVSLKLALPVSGQEAARPKETVCTGQIYKITEAGYLMVKWPPNEVGGVWKQGIRIFLDGREVRVNELPVPVRADFVYEDTTPVRVHAYTKEKK